MGVRISEEDRIFCWMYGQQCRDFYGNVPWELGLPKLQQGWLRVRGPLKLDWNAVEDYVHEGWNAAAPESNVQASPCQAFEGDSERA